jgi:uncharacterized protein (TIGR02118 family)
MEASGEQHFMVKHIILFIAPPDNDEFEKHLRDIHVPLVERYPGAQHVEVTRFADAPLNPVRYHTMVEVKFESEEAMQQALSSAEGKAVARDLMAFAARHAFVYSGTIEK